MPDLQLYEITFTIDRDNRRSLRTWHRFAHTETEAHEQAAAAITRDYYEPTRILRVRALTRHGQPIPGLSDEDHIMVMSTIDHDIIKMEAQS